MPEKENFVNSSFRIGGTRHMPGEVSLERSAKKGYAVNDAYSLMAS